MALQKIGLVAVLDLSKFNRAFNKYINSLGTMNSKTDSTARNLSNQFLGLGGSILKVAGILTGALVAAAGIAAAALAKVTIDSIQKAADLEQGIANIAAVLNMTKEEADFLKTVIIDLGLDPRLKVTTFEAAEVMEILAKNGIFAGQSLQEMEETARGAATASILLANATGADFGQAADIATDAMILFNKEASDMVDIVSGITSVTTNSKFTIDDYELAIRNGGAAAAQMGVSLEDFNVAVAASAEELGKGRKAGTGMLNFINRLTPNSKKATGVMEDLGLIVNGNNQFFDEATGELKDMGEVSRLLNDVLFGTSAVFTEVGGRTQEQNAILEQLNDEYTDATQTIFDYTQGAKSLTSTEEAKNKALEEAQATIDAITPRMDELNAITGELTVSNAKLTDEQRSVALETIFGNDGMKTAIALAKEGAVVTGDFQAVMESFGVSQHEATLMIAEGLTQWDLLQAQMSQTDAVENAETRMDTLKGKIEILGGVLEAIQINIGDAFLPMLTRIAERIQNWIDLNPTLIDDISKVSTEVATLVEAILTGQPPLESMLAFFDNIGQAEIGTAIQQFITDIENLVEPVIAFVNEHGPAFEGAIKGIAAVFGASAIAAIIAGIVSALSFLVSPLGILIVAAAALGAAWETNFLGIQDAVKEVAGVVGPILKEIITNVGLLIQAFQTGEAQGQLQEGFAQIQGAIESVMAVLEPFIELIRDSLQTAIANISGSVEGFVPVWNQLKETFEALMPVLEVFGALIAASVVVTIGVLIGLFGALAAALDPFLAMLALVLEGVLQFAEGVLQLFTGLVEGVIGLITGNTQAQEEAWAKMGEGVTNIILGFVQTVISLFVGVLTTVEQLVMGFVQNIVAFFQSLSNTLVGNSIIPDMVNSIIEWIFTLVDTVIEAVQTWLGDMLALFIDKTNAILDRIISWVLDMIAKWVELREKVIEQVRQWWADLIEMIKTKAAEVLEQIQTLITNMIQIITDARDSFVTAGASIVSGIVDGIKGQLAAAQEAILSVAREVQDAWSDFWDTGSPSKVMIQSGRDIMKGAEIGAMDEQAPLSNVFASVGQSAMSSFLGSVGNVLPNNPAVAQTTTVNNTEQNFNVNNDFAGSPQITDADVLRNTLAGFA